MIDVLVVVENPDFRLLLGQLITEVGGIKRHVYADCITGGAGAREMSLVPAAVVTDGGDLSLLEAVWRDRRVVVAYLFVGQTHGEVQALIEANPTLISLPLLLPVAAEHFDLTLKALITHCKRVCELKQKNLEVRDKIEERRDIEIAKGLLEERFGFSEEDAYNHLKLLASGERVSPGEYARELIKADRIFHPLKKKNKPET